MRGSVPEFHIEACDAHKIEAVWLLKVDLLHFMSQSWESCPKLDSILANVYVVVSLDIDAACASGQILSPLYPLHLVGPQMNSPSGRNNCAHFLAASGNSASSRVKNSARNFLIGGGAFMGQIVSTILWHIAAVICLSSRDDLRNDRANELEDCDMGAKAVGSYLNRF